VLSGFPASQLGVPSELETGVGEADGLTVGTGDGLGEAVGDGDGDRDGADGVGFERAGEVEREGAVMVF